MPKCGSTVFQKLLHKLSIVNRFTFMDVYEPGTRDQVKTNNQANQASRLLTTFDTGGYSTEGLLKFNPSAGSVGWSTISLRVFSKPKNLIESISV